MINIDNWFPVTTSRAWADIRLFCFPHAGGAAWAYRRWCEKLPSFIDVRGAELPGHGGRLKEPAADDLAVLVPAVVDAMSALLDRPYALFGHSLGGIIAFELARALRSRCMPPPTCLIVSACEPPNICRVPSVLTALTDVELIRILREVYSTPVEVLDSPELMAIVLPTIRADFSMSHKYVYTPENPLDIPILALAGFDDHLAPPDAVRGWDRHTTAGFSFESFPGGHWFVDKLENVVLRKIARKLVCLVGAAGSLPY